VSTEGFVCLANLDRFRKALRQTSDPDRRRTIESLIAAELERLRRLGDRGDLSVEPDQE